MSTALAEEIRFPSRAASPRGRAIRPIFRRSWSAGTGWPGRACSGPRARRKRVTWVRAEATSHRAMPSTMAPTAPSWVSGARAHTRVSTSTARRTCSASSVRAAG